MSEWKRFFPGASDFQIERFEKAHGIVLPPHYRSYISSANGGQPLLHRVFMIPELNEKVLLGVLYGISDQVGSRVSLETVMAESNDDFPNGYIPIGSDPGGNHLLLATSGEHQEKIFFWDRIGFLAKRTGKAIFLLSENIDEFVESLRPI